MDRSRFYRRLVCLTRPLFLLASAPFLSLGVLVFQCAATAQAAPLTVLLLDQSDPNAPWGIEFRARLRSILSENKTPITIFIELADLGRFDTPEYENIERQYLRDKYRDKSIDVVVVHGSRMFEIALKLRKELWPSVPLVFATVDPVTLARLDVPPDVTGATHEFSLRGAFTVARALVPNLKQIVHVGSAWEHQPFFGQAAKEWAEISKEVEAIDFAKLPLQEIRKRISALRVDSAIIYTLLYRDGAGASFGPITGLLEVVKAANRPTITLSEAHIGLGAIGGLVGVPALVGEDTAKRVLRILDGEKASNLPIVAGNFTRPIFDWRQLERFGVDSRRLPPESEIRFRTPTMWDQYRSQMIAIFGVVLLQALMIAALLIERYRRQAAELISRSRLLEVMHLNRIATAGAMSASIAHELNQPLGAILSNAEAAKNLLARNSPDIDQIKEIIDDIRRDDQRAAEIIKRLRGLLKRKELESEKFDLNSVIANTLHILEPEAAKRNIKLRSRQTSEPATVLADQVHLQQVLLNLAMNGMDAVQSSTKSERELTFEAAISGNSQVECSISDTGDGIPAEKLEGVFETFFTTKPQGTGLGLSIARTIIETYGGKIWAENEPSGGATFRFVLPRA